MASWRPGLLNGAWILLTEPYPDSTGTLPTPDQVNLLAKVVAKRFFVNEKCAAHMGEESALFCIIPFVAYPFIKTPVFIAQSFYDSFNLFALNAVPREFHEPGVIRYLEYSREAAMTSLQEALNNPDTGVYLSSCLRHRLPWSGNERVQGLAVAEAFRKWYFGERSELHIFDACEGVACNAHCNQDFLHPPSKKQ